MLSLSRSRSLLFVLALALVGCPNRGPLPGRDGSGDGSADSAVDFNCDDPDNPFLPEECFLTDDDVQDTDAVDDNTADDVQDTDAAAEAEAPDAGPDEGPDAEGPDAALDAPEDQSSPDAPKADSAAE